MTLVSYHPPIDVLFCEMYIKHPPHEWSADKELFWCYGRKSYVLPGDERQAKRVYRCKRAACNRIIKTMAFQGPNEYCCVDCEKMDAGEYPIVGRRPVVTVPIRKVLQDGDSLTIDTPSFTISE